ncbi:MAG TPA: ATPase domain-containing protein [Gemmataceae bacterium]|nr:ATPase domain-containing protein [Gemmataceae bacterium]
MNPSFPPQAQRLSTGVEGLDRVLRGGLPRGRVYLVEGSPGTGKTTLALQFLLEGVRQKEPVLYFALSESRLELEAVAASHGWSLEGVHLCEIVATADNGEPEEPYTLFHPSEVELSETTKTICAEVNRVEPVRAVIDSLAEMRLLAQEPLIYRRQVLGLKQFFVRRQCTVLLLDDRRPHNSDPHFQSLVHGIISLEQTTPAYGAKRRQLEVIKVRGVEFHDGRHDFVIRKGGIVVHPRLMAAEHPVPFNRGPFPSGVAELDTLLGGGLERGTSALVMGPSGAGKSTLTTQYLLAAAQRGEHGISYLFDEGQDNFLARADSLGLDLRHHVEAGRIQLVSVNPAELSPGEFAQRVRAGVEKERSRVVVIDSLNGYINAMLEERGLLVQLHELLAYLERQGVLSLLVMAQHGLVDSPVQTPLDVSYLADTVLLLRYFEAAGEVRKAISVVKKRTGGHETTIREFRLGPSGIRVGPPLREFQGVLTGTPTYHGEGGPLMRDESGAPGAKDDDDADA